MGLQLIVRRIPELNPKKAAGQDALFDAHRYHAVFSTVPKDLLGTVDMDKIDRQHALIEAVNAELKDSALAHLPSGSFSANSAWLHAAAIAYNLARAAGILAAGRFTRAKMRTLRTKLILVPARIASSGKHGFRVPPVRVGGVEPRHFVDTGSLHFVDTGSLHFVDGESHGFVYSYQCSLRVLEGLN